MARNRWAYMTRADYNPPNDDCPDCKTPSRTYFIGAKTEEGKKRTRYTCECGHNWTVVEDLSTQQ